MDKVQELLNSVADTLSDQLSEPGTRVLVNLAVQTIAVDQKTGKIDHAQSPLSLSTLSSGTGGPIPQSSRTPLSLHITSMLSGFILWLLSKQIVDSAAIICKKQCELFEKITGEDVEKEDFKSASDELEGILSKESHKTKLDYNIRLQTAEVTSIERINP